MKEKVFITRPIPQAAVDILAAYSVTTHPSDTALKPAQLGEACRDAAGMVCVGVRVNEEVLSQTPHLKVVANCAVGYDNIDVAGCTRRGIVVTNTPGVLTDATADLAFALLLAVARRVVELDGYVRQQYPEGIPAMGADALRFTLLTGSPPGNDMNLSLQRVEGNRNFTNKIWNATRYILSQMANDEGARVAKVDRSLGDTTTQPSSVLRQADMGLPEKWILSRLSATITEATRFMEGYQFGEAGRLTYEFFWNEFCDWYLEISKIAIYRGDEAARRRAQDTLVHVLDSSLRLLHPFIPYVTEETWGYLKEATGHAHWPAALIIAPWPTPGPRDEAAEAAMDQIIAIIRAIRNVRAEYNVKPGHPIAAHIAAGELEAVLLDQSETLCTLARLDPDHLKIAATMAAPPHALTLVPGSVTVYLPLSELVDLAAERDRLGKELAEAESQLERSRQLLSGPFAQRAPANVVQREQEKQGDLQARAAKLRDRLADLS